MHTFKAGEHEWKINLTIPVMEKVRDATKVDIGHYDSLETLNISRIDLANVLWVMVERQAKKRKVSRDEFRSSLTGDAMENARQAYIEEYLDFCPSDHAAMLRQMIALDNREAQQTKAQLSRLLEKPEEKNGSSKGVTDVRESSASTPKILR